MKPHSMEELPLRRILLLIGLTAAMAVALVTTNGPHATPSSTATSPPGFEQLRKIDVHSHIYEDLPVVNAMLRRINLRVINVSVPATDGHLAFMHRFNAALVKQHPDIFSFASTFDLAARKAVVSQFPNEPLVVAKLFDEIAPKYADRTSGFTRIVRLGQRRGDAAEIVQIELV